MSRIAYVNGLYRPITEPLIEVEDRGYQFADAIYEVWGVRNGVLMDSDGHFARLERSLGELQIKFTLSRSALLAILKETQRRNRLVDGHLYLQVSRGAAIRDHAFPADARPVLVVTARHLAPAALEARFRDGVSVITLPEIRWARRDIKSTSLLANVLAKQQAREAGAFEAWFVTPDGVVTEGTSSNAWIVTKDGKLITQPLSNDILHGVTRAALIRLAQERQIPLEERGFSVGEAKGAAEAFLSSATNAALSIVRIDGEPVGDGKPGPVAAKLRDAYFGKSAVQG